MVKLHVSINGCDDNNCTVIEATDEQHIFLSKIAKRINTNSNSQCQPRMLIDLAENIRCFNCEERKNSAQGN